VGAVVLVEMAYHASAQSPAPFMFLGKVLDTRSALPWIVGICFLDGAWLLCRSAWRAARPRWAEVSAALGEAR
jgi:hypothetical protein